MKEGFLGALWASGAPPRNGQTLATTPPGAATRPYRFSAQEGNSLGDSNPPPWSI